MSAQSNIVLVDDDDVFVFLTKKIIKEISLINLIKVFDNGLDALNFLKENVDNPESLPEIILLDLSMPIMDGWQFLEEYIMLEPRLGRKITIFVVSSSISPDDLERAKSISAVTDYIIKPITKEKLIDIIKNIS